MTGVEADDLRQQIESLLARSRIARVIQVDEDGIVGRGRQSFTHQRRGADFVDAVAFGTKQKIESFEDMLLIVSGQDTDWSLRFLANRL